jgi:lysozyme
MQPEYAGRPWMLWTTNAMFKSEASANALRWVVVSR